MSLPKKKSRLITVDDLQFRCMIGTNNGYNIFYAELEGAKGQIIEVFFDTDIDKYWVEFPNVSNLNLKVLKPKEFVFIIRDALKLGWNPEEKGKPLLFDFQKERLTQR